MDDLCQRLLDLLGERGWVELLAVLELDESERAALIGQLIRRPRLLGELLADVESDPDDLMRLRWLEHSVPG